MSGGLTHSAAAAVDADAVCGVCGNVNPEGTLICRTCGNNLRDQKYRRQTTEQQLLEPEGLNVRQIVRGVGVVVGLLVILLTALNVNRIADAMVGAGAPQDPLEALFQGPEDAAFAPLVEQATALVAQAPADLSALAAAPLVGEGIAGNYVLAASDGFSGYTAVGVALVQQDESGTRFVALVGETQIRGQAQGQAGGAYQTSWDQAAMRDAAGALHGVAGVAVPQQDGSVECFGQTTLDDTNYSVLALRLP